MIYFDHNATTPIRPEVVEAMARASRDLIGNPSSVHAAGRAARDAVERARVPVSRLLGVTPEEIVFTSGGTEGDHLAIRGLAAVAATRGKRSVLTSPLEHPAVRGAVRTLAEGGFTVADLPVTARGEIRPADLGAALGGHNGDGEAVGIGLVTLAAANHELGNRYLVDGFAAAAHAAGALIHTDAVQAAGKIPLALGAWGLDAATISAHKIGGPKGVGAVFVRRGLDLAPLAPGGHQERERRPGTENVAGIVGFGVACELAADHLAAETARLRTLRRELRTGLTAVPGARFFGWTQAEAETETEGARADAAGLPGTLLVAFPGAPGQLVAIGLDLEGICVSTGAACTSGSLEPSPVLRALGLSPADAGEGLRFSLGWTSTAADVARLTEVLPAVVERVRGASR